MCGIKRWIVHLSTVILYRKNLFWGIINQDMTSYSDMHILLNKTVSPKTGVLYLKNVAITRMVWSVDRHVVTVATGSSVITWTEVVHLDVTLVFMAISVTLVVQFIYRIYLTFFNVVSNGSILLPLNNHIGIKNFCGIVFHSPTIE